MKATTERIYDRPSRAINKDAWQLYLSMKDTETGRLASRLKCHTWALKVLCLLKAANSELFAQDANPQPYPQATTRAHITTVPQLGLKAQHSMA
jgi:zona occludens toxin (predicted ATPase)